MEVLHVDGSALPRARDVRPRSPARRRAHVGRAGVPARIERRDLVRIFLVLLALTFVLRLPAFFTPVFNSDETFLATQAHVIERRRRALRGRHRPQAAARAVRLRGDVRVLRDHRAVVGAGGRDARGRAHRAAARDRGAPPLRRARGWIAGILFVRRDGRVRAARRAGRELRGVHAAVDDGGDPVRATRARVRSRASRSPLATLAKQTGAATLLPVVYLLARERGKRGVAEVARRLHHPDRARSRSPWARRSSSTGRCSATARTSA